MKATRLREILATSNCTVTEQSFLLSLVLHAAWQATTVKPSPYSADDTAELEEFHDTKREITHRLGI